ncbi:MAG: phosphatidylserine decarboxylase [Dorea sp.]|nr:phosphatidylserine decarboxylase [Dorea sp.]
MGYIDYNGIRYEDTSLQDQFLRKLYGNALGRGIVKILTVPVISKIAGTILNLPVSTCAIKPFIEKNKIDMSEYVEKEYTSYNDFFMREIKAGARPLPEDEDVLISPGDGRVSIFPVTKDGVFQIKHAPYTVATLLRDKKLAKKYEGGYCILVRLCVNDYHRYCYVANGEKTVNRRIEGILHTVNPAAAEQFPIYKENSREYTMIHTDRFGDVIQMEIGALMVGKIVNLHEKAQVQRGQEKGHFEFGGSSIILLVEKDQIEIRKDLISHTEEGYETLIRQGQELGRKL